MRTIPRVSAVRAAGPATRTALAISQVCASPVDALAPGLLLLGGFDPADPFVSRQRRDRLPGGKGCIVGLERGSDIVGKMMDDSAWNEFFLGHHERWPLFLFNADLMCQ